MTDITQDTKDILKALKTVPNSPTKPDYANYAKSLVHTPDISGTLNTYQPDNTDVPFELWETLAYDLALANTSDDMIAKAYDIDISQLEYLQRNQYFAKILQAKKDEVQQLGTDASFAVKMRMVANKATPQLLSRLVAMETSNRDFLAMFKTVTELARLLPEPSQDNNHPAIAQANVTFNISGVPGLDHLTTVSPPTYTQDDITDAEFDEVLTYNIAEDTHYADDELKEL